MNLFMMELIEAEYNIYLISFQFTIHFELAQAFVGVYKVKEYPECFPELGLIPPLFTSIEERSR